MPTLVALTNDDIRRTLTARSGTARPVWIAGDGYDRVPARDITEGMLLDLAGDIYADPARQDPALEHEYAEVHEMSVADYEVLVHTSVGSFAFPPDHVLLAVSDSG